MAHKDSHEAMPTQRVVLLGASNLTRSFPTVVTTARLTWGAPIEIMAAMGHGRSYGQETTLFARKISGIFPCALWQDLQTRPKLPTAALITDIGNDILYGVPPQRLNEWVARCVDRLMEHGAEVAITQLPIGNLERLSEARFHFFRRLLFPRSNLTLAGAKSIAGYVNDALLQLGEMRKVPVIPALSEWYGFDPIHLKRRAKGTAWSTYFASWRSDLVLPELPRTSIWTAAYLASLTPSERTILGIRRRRLQPSGRLKDGTTVSLY